MVCRYTRRLCRPPRFFWGAESAPAVGLDLLSACTTIVPRNKQGNHYGSNPTFTIGELDVLAAPKIGCTRQIANKFALCALRQGYQSIRQVRRRTQRTGDIEIGAIIVQNKPLPLLPASVAIGPGHIVSRMVFVDCRLMK